MHNYDRYRNYTENQYNKKGISWFFMKKQADKRLFPFVRSIRGKKVLEVGLGYGYYTKYLIENENTVIGLDINPELGEKIGIGIIQGKADQISEKICDKLDYVLSFFMTEYLNETELKKFIRQGIAVLGPQGIFATTVILNTGLGWLYVALARMKGIRKYCYSEAIIRKVIDREDQISIIPLKTVFNIPFAVLVKVEI